MSAIGSAALWRNALRQLLHGLQEQLNTATSLIYRNMRLLSPDRTVYHHIKHVCMKC